MNISQIGSTNYIYQANNANIESVRPKDVNKEENTELLKEDASLIGTSEDGDTAKASKKGLENVSEGIVINKSAEKAGAAAETAAKVETDDKKKEVDSLTSYSGDQLETLYEQGRITKNELDRELERRERLKGEDDEKLDEKAADKDIKKEDENKALTNEAGAKIAQNAVDAVKGEDKLGVNPADDEKAAERKQIITEEIEDSNKLNETVGALMNEEQMVTQAGSMIETARDNNRGEIIEQVLSDEKNIQFSVV